MLICFSGLIGSGRTSISSAVAYRLKLDRTGFGDYLREQLSKVSEGPVTRSDLQDFGQDLVESDPKKFCKLVLNRVDFDYKRDIIVDSIRHVKIYNCLKKLVEPIECRLIYIVVDEKQQALNLSNRYRFEKILPAMHHQAELDTIKKLPKIADEKIINTGDFKSVVDQCVSVIKKWQSTVEA